MGFPSTSTPRASDGIAGLLARIATSLDVLAAASDGPEAILAKIAAALQAAEGGATPTYTDSVTGLEYRIVIEDGVIGAELV